MRYLFRDKAGAWSADEYVAYIASVKAVLSVDALELASLKRLDFFSELTLHDAVVSKLTSGFDLHDNASGTVWLELRLVPPHRRVAFEIRYLDVESFEIGPLHRFHDLEVHELRVVGVARLEHEILFSNGLRILVCARDVSFREVEPEF